MKKLLLLLSIVSFQSYASNVGIIDSGVYFDHELLHNSPWINPGETFDNWVDDDQNGKVDDFYGWNFAENSPEIFNPNHIPFYHPVVYRVLEIASKIAAGQVTEEEREFWNTQVVGLPDAQKKLLIAQVNHYGQYAHGTHCAGVVAQGNPEAKIMAGKIFPDQMVPEPHAPVDSKQMKGIVDWIYGGFATLANAAFASAGSYLTEMKMDVANYSLGVPIPTLAKTALGLGGNHNPTDAEIKKESWRIFKAYEKQGRKWMSAASNTLFVVAAGNDHNDNENLPFFPANMDMENSITVAATQGYSKLADFSNYGIKHVHVAAPGVSIMSSVPGPTLDMQLPMSGTSMAAPFVTMVASKVKDLNPALTPAQIKKVLMGTVDKKEWLKDKVITSGVVNVHRASRAAMLSTTISLDKAIAQSRSEVADMTEEKSVQQSAPISEEMKRTAYQIIF